nr:ATP-grasp domain-containing protein [Caldicoprobacter algeriensis]
MESEASSYRVGLAFNLKKGIKGSVEDIEAEYDSIDTVMAIKNALESIGCRVELLEADHSFLDKLRQAHVDIVFNIAEGLGGRGREAHIPAILSFLGIPFTGSDETTLCIALDKALTKRLLTSFRILTPKYQLISHEGERIRRDLRFPLIVKPNAEGSSKGISSMAVVDNMEQFKSLLERNFRLYGQPMLIEEFIPGREFTVGVIGNGREARVFTPMEIVYKEDRDGKNIYSFEVKKDYKRYVEYVCPPDLSPELQKKLMDIAAKIYRVLQCRDFARMDFRMSNDNRFYFIEINPLPGLAPGYSDYPMIAEFCGVEYNTVIKMILNSALKRYGMAPVM